MCTHNVSHVVNPLKGVVKRRDEGMHKGSRPLCREIYNLNSWPRSLALGCVRTFLPCGFAHQGADRLFWREQRPKAIFRELSAPCVGIEIRYPKGAVASISTSNFGHWWGVKQISHKGLLTFLSSPLFLACSQCKAARGARRQGREGQQVIEGVVEFQRRILNFQLPTTRYM